MPTPGSKLAPRKFKGKHTEIKDFLKHYERLCAQNHVTSNREKCESITQYCSNKVATFIEALESYTRPDWETLKKDLLMYYDADRSQQRYLPKDLLEFVRKSREQPMRTLTAWKQYCRRYIRIGGFLLSQKRITANDHALRFWQGIHRPLREILETKIITENPTINLEVPFPVAKVCEVAERHLKRNKFLQMAVDLNDSEDELDWTSEDSTDDEKDRKRKKKKAKAKMLRKKKSKKSRDDDEDEEDEEPRLRCRKPDSMKQEEVEGLIRQLNSMSLEDPSYGLVYFKAIKLDNTVTSCVRAPITLQATTSTYRESPPHINATVRPVYQPRGPPRTYAVSNGNPSFAPRNTVGMNMMREERRCYGCNDLHHTMSNCPAVTTALEKGLVRMAPGSRRLMMADGSDIFRERGESLIEAAERQAPAKSNYVSMGQMVSGFYATIHEEEELTSHPEAYAYSHDEEYSEDDIDDINSIYVVNGSQYNNEESEEWVRVMPVERGIKESTAARKAAFDGVYPPPLTRGKGWGKENIPLNSASFKPVSPRKLINSTKQEAVKVSGGRLKMHEAPDESREPVPVDARKTREVRFDNGDEMDGVEETGVPVLPRTRGPGERKGPPGIKNPISKVLPKNGRQSAISSEVQHSHVVDHLLDLQVTMPLRQVLGTSREVCSELVDRLKPRNTKIPLVGIVRNDVPGKVMTNVVARARNGLIELRVECDGRPITAVIDTGSQLNIVDQEISDTFIRRPIDTKQGILMNDANGGVSELAGLIANVPLTLGAVTTHASLYVGEKMPFNLLLGRPWQRGNFVSIDERVNGTYLVFKDPENLEARYSILVAPEENQDLKVRSRMSALLITAGDPVWEEGRNLEKDKEGSGVVPDKESSGATGKEKVHRGKGDEAEVPREERESPANAEPAANPNKGTESIETPVKLLTNKRYAYLDLASNSTFTLAQLGNRDVKQKWDGKHLEEEERTLVRKSKSRALSKSYKDDAKATVKTHRQPSPLSAMSSDTNTTPITTETFTDYLRRVDPSLLLPRGAIHHPGPSDWEVHASSPFETLQAVIDIERRNFIHNLPPHIRPMFLSCGQTYFLNHGRVGELEMQEAFGTNATFSIYNPETRSQCVRNGQFYAL